MPRPCRTRKRVRTIRHLAIEERLEPRHREALRVLVLDPATRLVTVERWLTALGCPSSPASLCRYRQHLRRERSRSAAEALEVEREAANAVAYACAARELSPAVFHRGALFLCQCAAFLSSLLLKGEGEDAVLEAAGGYARAALLLEDLRLLLDEREAAGAAPPVPTPAAGGRAP